MNTAKKQVLIAALVDQAQIVVSAIDKFADLQDDPSLARAAREAGKLATIRDLIKLHGIITSGDDTVSALLNWGGEGGGFSGGGASGRW